MPPIHDRCVIDVVHLSGIEHSSDNFISLISRIPLIRLLKILTKLYKYENQKSLTHACHVRSTDRRL